MEQCEKDGDAAKNELHPPLNTKYSFELSDYDTLIFVTPVSILCNIS